MARLKMSFYVWLFFRVGGAHCVGCCSRRLKCLGHRESDVLSVIADHVVFEWGPALFTHTIKAWRRRRTKNLADVLAVKNFANTGHLLGRRSIEREQFAIRDGRLYRNGIEHSWEMKIRRVLCQSGDLQGTVDPQSVAADW